jgi:hypothetical protein
MAYGFVNADNFAPAAHASGQAPLDDRLNEMADPVNHPVKIVASLALGAMTFTPS